MSDYISREAAIEKMREAGCTDCCGSSDGLCGFCDFENAVRLVKSLPAADVEPVRHGRWEIRRKSDWPEWAIRIVCSSCGLITGQRSEYCPKCGAKMDLEEKQRVLFWVPSNEAIYAGFYNSNQSADVRNMEEGNEETPTEESEDIMAEITLDQDQIIKNVNERITQDLAAAIKQVAKDGVWEDAEEDDGVDPEKIIRRTMATYMGGSVPGWFLDALQATSYVMATDKLEGYGCIAALYEAASKAQAVKRMAALTKLLAISTPLNFMAGLANTKII